MDLADCNVRFPMPTQTMHGAKRRGTSVRVTCCSTRFPEAKNQPAFSLVVARRLPTPANHHHSYTCHNVRFSLYYAIRFQVVLQGEKRGRHAIPAVDWIFALVPGGVALDAVPVITGAKASATLASPSVNNTP